MSRRWRCVATKRFRWHPAPAQGLHARSMSQPSARCFALPVVRHPRTCPIHEASPSTSGDPPDPRGATPAPRISLRRASLTLDPNDPETFTSREPILQQKLLHSTTPAACERILRTRTAEAFVPEDPRYDGFQTVGDAPLPFSPACAYFAVRPQADRVLYPFSIYPQSLAHGARLKNVSIDATVLLGADRDIFYVSTTPTQFGHGFQVAYTSNLAVVSRNDSETMQLFEQRFTRLNKGINSIFRFDSSNMAEVASHLVVDGQERQHSVIFSFVGGLKLPKSAALEVTNGVKIEFAADSMVSCPERGCQVRCNSVSALKQHYRAVHLGLKLYSCPTCCDRFSTKAYLAQHVAAVHQHSKPHKCSDCDEHFSQKSNLAKHIASVHKRDEQQRIKCTKCDQTFSEKRHMLGHVSSVHGKEKPYVCQECHTAFSQRGSLARHIATVHDNEKQFECSLCSTRFSQKGNMLRHMATIHGC